MPLNHILRRQGIRGRSSRPEMVTVTEELLGGIEKLQLLEPVFTYRAFQITELTRKWILLDNGARINGELLPSVLSKSKELTVVVCTIGPRLQDRVSSYLKKGEALRGLLLDGIGTAAIDALTAQACKSVRKESLTRGYQASSPLCPGMPGFALSEQWTLLEIASASEIGVTLSSTGVMVPCKSTSAVIGIGPEMPTWTQAKVCAHCNLAKTCPYRIRA